MSDIAFDHAPVGLAVLENRVIKRCNQQFAITFGGTPADHADVLIAELYPSREDYHRIGQLLQQDEGAKTGLYNDERIMRRHSGELFWCRVRGRSITPDDPFRTGIWSFADISEDRPVVSLTPREREVAILTCKGLSAKEIGLKLDLSYRTIETHRARLFQKFNAPKLPEPVPKLSGTPL